ncbi:MAG: YtxH domain-containing protein [Ktedonobacteraceae bacterium]|jgi:gas vesicle protein|nr:YtxH domain-containing protein [Ktedonobacteraceae bacterium]
MRFLFGLLLGVIIGLLIAPQPGEVTRARLAQQGIQLPLRGDLGARALEALAQGQELYTRTKNELTNRYAA